MMQRIASSQTSRLVSMSRPKPPSSVIEADSPVPNLDAAVGDQVEAGDAFGHALRRVGGKLHDAVAEADVLRPLAGGAEEHLRRGGMGILLEEMVLHFPGVVVAQPIRQLDLVSAFWYSRCSSPGPQGRGSCSS